MIRKRPLQYYLVGLLFFLLAGLALIAWDVIRNRMTPADSGATKVTLEEPDDPSYSTRYEATLYFVSQEGSSDRGLLVPESRLMAAEGSVQARAAALLEELAKGSVEGHLPAIPTGARLLHFFLTRQGTALVNYSRDLIEQHPGGVEGELATVYAIVNTLTTNVPEILAVRLLVDGEERETLVGHLDVSEELKRNLTFVRGFEYSIAPIQIERLPP